MNKHFQECECNAFYGCFTVAAQHVVLIGKAKWLIFILH